MSETEENKKDDNTFAKEALQCEIGDKLKKTREAKEMSTDFVVKELKFSQTFVEALESGDWSLLPDEVYVLGFLRQYSKLLSLDLDVEINRFKAKSFELTAPLTYPDAPISPNKKWVGIAVVMFILILITANFGSDDNDAVTSTEPVKTTPANALTDQQDQALEADYNQTNMTADNILASESNIADMNDAGVADSDTVKSSVIETKVIKASKKLLIADDNAVKAPVVATEKNTYSFFAATNDVWLQLFEVDENSEAVLLREVLLKMGQSFSIIDTSSKLLLTAGNPRALEILEGSDVLYAAGTLGQEDKVLRSFRINP